MDFNSFENIYKNDPEKSSEGIPFEIGSNKNGSAITMKIAEANISTNKKFAKVLRKYDRALELSRKNPDRRKSIWIKIVAESVLIDWENVIGNDNQPVEATLENKIAALTKYDDLLAEILAIANDRTNYIPEDAVEAEEDTEKNSQPPSSGT